MDEGVLAELIEWDSIRLDWLKAFKQEEGHLDGDFLVEVRPTHPITTVVDLADKLLHVHTVEGRHAEDHLVENDAQRPGVHSLVVLLAAENLGATVQWRPDERKILIIWFLLSLVRF